MPPLYLWYNVNVGFSGADFEIPEPEFRIIGWCGQILNCAARPVRRDAAATSSMPRLSPWRSPSRLSECPPVSAIRAGFGQRWPCAAVVPDGRGAASACRGGAVRQPRHAVSTPARLRSGMAASVAAAGHNLNRHHEKHAGFDDRDAAAGSRWCRDDRALSSSTNH